MAAGTAAASSGRSTGAPLSVFVVYGERDAPLVTDFTPPVVAQIANERPRTWRLGAEVLPGAGHTPPEALARGLRFVFEAQKAEGMAMPQGLDPSTRTLATHHSKPGLSGARLPETWSARPRPGA